MKEFRAIKALCLTLNPDIPLSVIHQSSKLLAVVAIDVDGQSHIIRALTENAEEFTDENGFPKKRFKNLVNILRLKIPEDHEVSVFSQKAVKTIFIFIGGFCHSTSKPNIYAAICAHFDQ